MFTYFVLFPVNQSSIFCVRLFHESSFPKPLKITLGSFKIVFKIVGDIRKSRHTTGKNNTGGKFAGMTPMAICHRYQRRDTYVVSVGQKSYR
jgi:hypothetical protein